ncbi:MAG: hypothetical protein BGN97_03725 [Microbacterium sp. 69-10]|uniref:hypothetical protein n=1 Tax=Microbacterium sp. 69-10 TaxID=1895783 RepID=UPI00095BE159|nr:hypothetical protein [Microbacterium sp. 69-10]OJU41820.1 MAG: hypothetical protein BGN97_03725 [Microbacterium sp. 69-10]
MNRQAHFEAILTHARERPNLIVHDSAAPLDSNNQIVRGQYVVLHDLGPDEIGNQRFMERDTVVSARQMRVVGRCVGVDPPAARRTADAFKVQVDQFVIVTPGRECTPLVIDEESEVTEDKGTSPSLWYVDVDFTYWSNPAG